MVDSSVDDIPEWDAAFKAVLLQQQNSIATLLSEIDVAKEKAAKTQNAIMSQVATITRLREEQVCLVVPPSSTLLILTFASFQRRNRIGESQLSERSCFAASVTQP